MRQPAPQRSPETGLGAMDHVVGEEAGHGLLEHPLAAAAALLEAIGQPLAEGQELGIEEGHTHLHTGRHRDDLSAMEVVISEEEALLEGQQLLQAA